LRRESPKGEASAPANFRDLPYPDTTTMDGIAVIPQDTYPAFGPMYLTQGLLLFKLPSRKEALYVTTARLKSSNPVATLPENVKTKTQDFLLIKSARH
jgi:hypothetical protein